MMKKKPVSRHNGKPRTWLITALLAAIAVAYVIFVFLPGQRSIGEFRAQVQERRQQILQAQTLTRTVALARQRLADTREVGQQWRARAPRHTQLITHFASLTQQAEAAGVAIDRLDPLPAVELHLITQQNVTLQFHAPFVAVFDFIRRLEALPGTTWVRNLRLHTVAEADRMLRGELTLTIFVDRTDYAD
jgi:Tfp pilus assembly protein PilO